LEVTEVKITLMNEDKLKAFANITLDNEFVIRDLKVINGKERYFVSMPNKRRKDGVFQDIAHPITREMRQKIEEAVLNEYTKVKNQNVTSQQSAE